MTHQHIQIAHEIIQQHNPAASLNTQRGMFDTITLTLDNEDVS